MTERPAELRLAPPNAVISLATMKFRLPLLACWLALAPWLAAQAIRVELLTEQDQFLPGEPLLVGVRITNLSGRPLQFGVSPDWLNFAVKGPRGEPITRSAEFRAPGAVVIQNAETQTRKVDISPFFDLTQPGPYTLTALVRVEESGEFRPSQGPRRFEIVKGTRVWEQAFGAPAGSDPSLPETRKFALVRSPNPKRMRLYLRLTDAEEKRILKVVSLGQAFTFNTPEVQMDRLSLLHVLHQTAARSFTYHVISPDGDVVLRHTYEHEGTRPALKNDADGRTAVAGGIRKAGASDFPPPEPPLVAPRPPEPKSPAP